MSNKNDTGRIPETGVMTAYERWELPSLDEQDEAANEVEIEPVTADEVEEIRLNAYQDGLTKGKEKGYKEGFDKGHQEGHQQGSVKGEAEGHKQGFDQGQKEGLTQGQSSIDAEVKKLAEMITQFDSPQAQLNKEVQDSLLNVVTAVARTVVHRELQTDTSQVQSLLKTGLDHLESSKDQVEVMVNPADLIQVERAAEEAGATWKITANEDILPGGVKLKSGSSLVDLSAEHRFQQAILNLLGRTDWAVDLAADAADERQKTLTSLVDDYDLTGDDSAESDHVSEEADSLASNTEDDHASLESSDALDEEISAKSELADKADSVQEDNANEQSLPPSDTSIETAEGQNELASDSELDAELDAGLDQNSAVSNHTEASSVIDEPITAAEPGVVEDASTSDVSAEESSENTEAPQIEMETESSASEGESQVDTAINEETTDFTPLAQDAPVLDESARDESARDENARDDVIASDQTPETAAQALDASDEVFDLEAAVQDENTTVYHENPTVSDLMEQAEAEESASSDTNSSVEDSLVGEASDTASLPSGSHPADEKENINQTSANPTTASPEVQSMMQPVSHGGFEAFGWQAPQAQQAQAQAQQAQMQAHAANAQAQQAQMHAQHAQAQAQQAQAHAQVQAQQAQAHAQAQQAQAMNQQQMNYQPQYAPQGYPVQPGMVASTSGAFPQQGMVQQGMTPQNMNQQNMVPQGVAPNMMPQGIPAQAMPPMQGGAPSTLYPNFQPGQWGTYQGVPVQPVPLVPSQQSGFSAFSFSGNAQGLNTQGGNTQGGNAPAPGGFSGYPYPQV